MKTDIRKQKKFYNDNYSQSIYDEKGRYLVDGEDRRKRRKKGLLFLLLLLLGGGVVLGSTLPFVLSRSDNTQVDDNISEVDIGDENGKGNENDDETGGESVIPSTINEENFTWKVIDGTNTAVLTGLKDRTSYSSEIDIPAKVTISGIEYDVAAIGDNAFKGCNDLKSVKVPDSVIRIENGAFMRCSNLTDISIGNEVITIGKYAFSYCDSLTNVTIPDNVISIGEIAFLMCKNLTSVTIGESVEVIGDDVFQSCPLENIEINPNNTTYGFVSSSLVGDAKVVAPLDDIHKFNYHNKPAGSLACGHLVIPDNIQSIGWAVFMGCSGLKSVTIGSNVNDIGDFAFMLCHLNDIEISRDNTTYGFARQSRVGNATVVVPKNEVNNYNYQTRIPGSLAYGDLVIPDDVMTIGDANFYGSWISSATIPNGVRTIGKDALRYCYNLKSVVIPYSVKSMGEGALNGCIALRTVVCSEAMEDYLVSRKDLDVSTINFVRPTL